jgi:4-diphosphocytidyl-2-C-methyl-D-erythritol kinase
MTSHYSVPSKLNLYLRLTGKRKDGFNNLCTVFQKISLSDDLKVKKIPRGCTIIMHGNVPPCATRDNLMYRAYAMLKKKKRFKGGVKFEIVKNIPFGGGLGGASANCAYALIAINDLYSLKLAKQELIEIGSALGSDVPFFLHSYTTALGIGKGDQVIDLGKIPSYWVLVIIFKKPLATKDVYAKVRYPKDFQINLTKIQREVIMLSQFLSNGKIVSHGGVLKNDLSDVAFRLMPEISTVLKDLKKKCACACAMTGSGSTVFAIFSNTKDAHQAKKKLMSYTEIRSMVVCRTLH